MAVDHAARSAGLASLLAASILAAFVLAPPIASGGTPVGTSPKCQRPSEPVAIEFSKDAYPHIIRHIKKSWRLGYRKVLRINRPGADARRDKALAGIPTKDGFDRDEAPAAVLRKRWRADVAYVPSSENRSAGASLGNQIAPYCNGVRVRYVFVP